METLTIHPVADIFPMLDKEGFAALKADIKSNGLLEPVWIHPDTYQIIDGRNRYKACIELDRPVETRTWSGDGDLLAFVLGLNLHRRHLSASQKAALAVTIEEYEAVEAKERQLSGLKKGDDPVKEKIPEREKGQARTKAAKAVGVNDRYVQDAKRIKKEAPEIFPKLQSGEVTLQQAKKELRTQERKASVATLKQKQPTTYNVIYADPPWQYSNTGTEGAAEKHYPTMPLQDISTLLDDKGIEVDDNAVLFMWVTNPLLLESFDVLEGWGFNYKTNICWIKTELKSPGVGFYVRGQHELLIIATRGSFLPLEKKATPSVLHSPIREHSRKPDEVYDLIEEIYPNCNYLEIFARTERDGWDCYGNQTDTF